MVGQEMRERPLTQPPMHVSQMEHMSQPPPTTHSPLKAKAYLVGKVRAIHASISSFFPWVDRQSRFVQLSIGFPPIFVIGILNHFTSPLISSSLFYLLPILFVTHFTGRLPGVVAAVMAIGLWFTADISGPTRYDSLTIPVWNATMRLGVFLIVVWLVDSMKTLMSSLEDRVVRRTEQLQVESAERRELEKRILEISEREQARMGQDLHDGLCQQLVGAAFSVNLLLENLTKADHPETNSATRIAGLLDESITQARRLARGLYPVRIEELGLATALEELSDTMTTLFRVKCGFHLVGEAMPTDQLTAVHLYRIAQEAANNASRHASPSSIHIHLSTSRSAIELRVEDDGIGLQQEAAWGRGLGLRIMEYRARMIGAKFEIGPRKGGGTLVTCSLSEGNASSQQP
jgi:signal transduction histidine kinase